ncbi:MAG: LPS assembly lipoprotein LptE [Rhodospirillales bacterium]
MSSGIPKAADAGRYDSHRSGRRPLRWRGLAAAIASVVVLSSAGCGFRPMYGQHSDATASGASASPIAADLATVDVAPIPDRSGQLLRNKLERLLDPAASASVDHRYTLDVQLKEKIDTYAVERSGFASRATIETTAKYALREDASGNQVFSGTTRAVSGYNLLDNDFSTVVGADDARNRAIDQVAYQIRNKLAVYFTNPALAAAAAASSAKEHPGDTTSAPPGDAGPDIISQPETGGPVSPSGQ